MKPSAVSNDNPLDPTDASLMAGIRSRDSQALAQLYDRHSSMVFALCVRMLRDRNEAEDVMLEVFWELWNRAERYDASRGGPLTYLSRVTRSRLIDRLRAHVGPGRKPSWRQSNRWVPASLNPMPRASNRWLERSAPKSAPWLFAR